LKLPIPIPSLSGLLSRFRKRGAEEDELEDQDALDEGEDASEEDSGEDQAVDDEGIGDVGEFDDDLAVGSGKPRRKWGRVVAIVGTVVGTIVILGGLGTVVGWLIVNAEHAAEMREKLHPTLTIDVIAEGEPAPENSSRDAMEEMAKEDALAETQGDGTMAADAKDADSEDPVDSLVGIVNADLVEQTDNGPLPKISTDGRQSWIEYSRPFVKTDRRPRLAIIVANLGLSPRTTDAALETLPPEVTLSFSSITPDLQDWITRARRKGHEVLVDLPMEPEGFPRSDPGRNTLLTSASEVENLNRLENVMKLAGGYVGLLATIGSRFTVDAESLSPILQTLKERGLLYVDSRATSRSMGPELASQIQLPRAFSNRFIDMTPSVRAIDSRLLELEELTKINRFAVGVAHPLPVTLDRLVAWLPSLKAKGIALVPITAIADKQSLR
jgi:uncharacterized protein